MQDDIKKVTDVVNVSFLDGMTARDDEVNRMLRERTIDRRRKNFKYAGFGEHYNDVNTQMWRNPIYSKIWTEYVNFINIIKSGKVRNAVFTGTVGTGKTAFMAYMAKSILMLDLPESWSEYSKVYAKENNIELRDIDVRYATSDMICQQLYKSSGYSPVVTKNKIIREFCEPDVLFIDEIGRSTTNKEAEFLFDVIDSRYRSGHKCTVICSNMDIKKLVAFMGDASFNRLVDKNALSVFDFNGLPCKRTETASPELMAFLHGVA